MKELKLLIQEIGFQKKIKILDVGFGSGRDSLYFKNKGYNVYSIDTVKEFCDYAKSKGLDNVYCISIEDINYINEFDAIWACASLLHIELNKLEYVFNKCYKALKNNGVMYVSFKYGTFEGFIDDRYFTYLNEDSFNNIIKTTNFKVEKILIKEDKLNRDIKWLNAIIKKEEDTYSVVTNTFAKYIISGVKCITLDEKDKNIYNKIVL